MYFSTHNPYLDIFFPSQSIWHLLDNKTHIIHRESLLHNLSPTNPERPRHELVRLNRMTLAGSVTIYDAAKVQLTTKPCLRMPRIGWTRDRIRELADKVSTIGEKLRQPEQSTAKFPYGDAPSSNIKLMALRRPLRPPMATVIQNIGLCGLLIYRLTLE